jgi:alpha-L-fucosidase 2
MKRFIRFLCATSFAFALAGFSAGVNDNIDWEKFLQRHDLVWETLPDEWHEGAFLGNGLVGTMIYANTNGLQFDVGRSDVVDRAGRIAIGNLTLVPPGSARTGTMQLDLWNAEASGKLKTDKTEITWRAFTHADRMITAIELEERRGLEPARIVFKHLPSLPARVVYDRTNASPNQINPEPAFGETGEVQWCRQEFNLGGGYVAAWGEHRMSPNRRLILFTVDFATNGSPKNALTTTKAVSDIQIALKTDYERLRRTHREWWHAFYPKSFLSIPDTRMESFYWLQMYKLASATRSDRMAIDLMGPWFRNTPWPRIWWNLNIQLTYWPVYTANRLDLGESLTKLIDNRTETLIQNVPAAWREDSAAIGRSASYDCVRSVNGREGGENGNLTWALHNYWLQYRYSGDERMLRERLFPILRRSINYYLHLVKPEEDGRLHLLRSISPEYPQQAPDTNYDLSLLRWGLQTLLAINERFKLNDPLVPKWKETLEKLVPYPVDPDTGYMVGTGVPFKESHRHYSHLFMFYPLHLVDPESPADRPLMQQSLDHWQSLKPALRGYSYTGAAAMSAWLGRNNDTDKYLHQFLEFREGKAVGRYPIRANTMYTEAGPVIETPLSGAASIHEFLLQSWSMDTFGTHIRVFPAVPDSWKDVSFHKLLAEGAFEISAARRDGKTKWVQIRSLAGAPCRVRTGLENPVAVSGSRKFQIVTAKDQNGLPLTTIDLRKGETILFASEGEKLSRRDLMIEPVAPDPRQLNFYGSPKSD